MTARARRTTTLVGPNRLALGAATGGLVALASAGTALLVLTGTSAVTPHVMSAPPLPMTAPLAHAPGVVVVPSPVVHAPKPADVRPPVRVFAPARPAPAQLPPALAFALVEAAPVAPVLPVVMAVPPVPPVPPPAVDPALRRAPEVLWGGDERQGYGRHLARGHRPHVHKPAHGHAKNHHRAKPHHHKHV